MMAFDGIAFYKWVCRQCADLPDNAIDGRDDIVRGKEIAFEKVMRELAARLNLTEEEENNLCNLAYRERDAAKVVKSVNLGEGS